MRQIVEEINERIRVGQPAGDGRPAVEPHAARPRAHARGLARRDADAPAPQRDPRAGRHLRRLRAALFRPATMPTITTPAPSSCTGDSDSPSTTQATKPDVIGSAIPSSPVRVGPRLPDRDEDEAVGHHGPQHDDPRHQPAEGHLGPVEGARQGHRVAQRPTRRTSDGGCSTDQNRAAAAKVQAARLSGSRRLRPVLTR